MVMTASTGRRIPPLIMGHEAAGVVAGVGAGIRSVALGDRVTFDSTVSCGQLHTFCLAGAMSTFARRGRLWASPARSSTATAPFAEFVAVPGAHRVSAARQLRF